MSEMTRRERVLRCYEFECPDRVPIMHSYYKGALIKHGQELIDILARYPDDFSERKIENYNDLARDLDSAYYSEEIDAWGCKWVYRSEGIAGMPLGHPLNNLRNLSSYSPPDVPFSEGPLFEELHEQFQQTRKSIVLHYSGPWIGGFCLFERMQWLRGYFELMSDIADEKSEVDIIADIVVETNLKQIIYAGALGADVLWFADDWGTQNGLMICPSRWRSIFKPRYKRMFDECHKANMKVLFHSDGNIIEIIPDLIEIGADILQPQFSCVDIRKMAELTRGRIAVISDLDRQHVLPFGSPDDVKRHVKEVIEVFGLPEGGLVGKGEIMADVPMENVSAMMDAFIEYGKL